MAGDWIKWSKGLASRREVVLVAAKLGLDRHDVAGRLMVLWEWADDNIPDSDIDDLSLDASLSLGDKAFSFIDALVCFPGFADALASSEVRWLTARSSGRIAFPHFGRHNGTTAKTRALESRKKQRQRAKGKKSSPETSRNQRDNNGTREERREESNNLSLSSTAHDEPIPVPPLRTWKHPPGASQAVCDAIDVWQRHQSLTNGRPDNDVQIETSYSHCLQAGWSQDKIARSIPFSIFKHSRSWIDPDVDYQSQRSAPKAGKPSKPKLDLEKLEM